MISEFRVYPCCLSQSTELAGEALGHRKVENLESGSALHRIPSALESPSDFPVITTLTVTAVLCAFVMGVLCRKLRLHSLISSFQPHCPHFTDENANLKGPLVCLCEPTRAHPLCGAGLSVQQLISVLARQGASWCRADHSSAQAPRGECTVVQSAGKSAGTPQKPRPEQ